MRDSRVYTFEQQPPKMRNSIGAHIWRTSKAGEDGEVSDFEVFGAEDAIEPFSVACPSALLLRESSPLRLRTFGVVAPAMLQIKGVR